MCLSYKSFVYIVLYLVRVSRYSSCYLSFFFWRDLGLFFHFFYRLDFEFLALTLLVWSFHSAVFFLWRFCSGLFPLILYIFPHLCYSFWVPLCFLGEWFTIFFPCFFCDLLNLDCLGFYRFLLCFLCLTDSHVLILTANWNTELYSPCLCSSHRVPVFSFLPNGNINVYDAERHFTLFYR